MINRGLLAKPTEMRTHAHLHYVVIHVYVQVYMYRILNRTSTTMDTYVVHIIMHIHAQYVYVSIREYSPTLPPVEHPLSSAGSWKWLLDHGTCDSTLYTWPVAMLDPGGMTLYQRRDHSPGSEGGRLPHLG